MADIRWVKIQSWHAVKGERILNVYRTYCGRIAATEAVDELPDERSCESCLRIVGRLADAT